MSDSSENTGQKDDFAEADSSMQGPHNRFVLGYFGSPSEARGLLEAQLPASLKNLLRMGDLVVENSHFVNEQMAEVESDLLFRIPRNDREGDVYIYVLWEHQRKRDSLMALRMWIYMGMIYRQLAGEGRVLPGNKLPFIYPLVLFQSEEGWRKGLVLEELIDLEGLPMEVQRWVPKFEIDLIRLDEDTERVLPEDPLARLGISLMQAVMHRDVKSWLEENITELNRIYSENREAVVLILTYSLMSGAGLTEDEFQSIIIAKGESTMKYEAGSVAEQLVKRGKAEGKVEGIAEGKAEANEKTALRLIEKGMDDREISEITELPIEKIAELRKKGSK